MGKVRVGLAAGLAVTFGALAGAATNELLIEASGRTGPRIHRNVYGHFAEHVGEGVYGGIWVGEDSPIRNTRGIRDDVVEALRVIGVPVLRWPGGCFADAYHWRGFAFRCKGDHAKAQADFAKANELLYD